MTGRRVIKQLSDMAIDEVSLVDRGANQHALISFAKRHSSDVEGVFAKARTVTNLAGNDDVERQEFHGNDAADVVDEHVANDGHGDTGPGETISGTQKVSAKDVTGKSSPGKTKKAGKVASKEDLDSDCFSSKGEKNLPEGLLKKSAGDADDVILAKALGLVVDDYEFEKGFGPQDPQQQQQGQQAPQFGNPPTAQTVGAQPFGQGAPQQPPMTANPMLGGPNPTNPGMPSGGPQVPGPTAMNPMAMNAAGGGMGMASMMGQTGAPPQLGVGQLPPEVLQYIQTLEQKVASLQGNDPNSQSQNPSSSEGSDSSNDSGNSDDSNKPFGKSGAFTMNEDVFLEELSKAIRDEDGRAEISKALQARFEAYETEISKAQELAASERDLRLEREFIAKAAEFEVPVAPEELGPVLKRAAESLSIEDFSVIVKCLDAATELSAEVFGEVGKRGTGANADIFGQVEAQAAEIAKSANVSREQATAQLFTENPAAYDEYRKQIPGFRF